MDVDSPVAPPPVRVAVPGGVVFHLALVLLVVTLGPSSVSSLSLASVSVPVGGVTVLVGVTLVGGMVVGLLVASLPVVSISHL